MIQETRNRIPLYFFRHLLPAGSLIHGLTTRQGGVSLPPQDSLNLGINTNDTTTRVAANHGLLARALGFDLTALYSGRQVHGARILTVPPGAGSAPGTGAGNVIGDCDGLITTRPGTVVMVRVADCLPIVLWAPTVPAVAVVHAGWRGTLQGIAATAVHTMGRDLGIKAKTLLIGLGPCIGVCCCRIGPEVADRFHRACADAGRFISVRPTGAHLDLVEANRLQLLTAGCCRENIGVAGMCTSCRSDIFFSHRREQGKTGRFALLAGIRA